MTSDMEALIGTTACPSCGSDILEIAYGEGPLKLHCNRCSFEWSPSLLENER